MLWIPVVICCSWHDQCVKLGDTRVTSTFHTPDSLSLSWLQSGLQQAVNYTLQCNLLPMTGGIIIYQFMLSQSSTISTDSNVLMWYAEKRRHRNRRIGYYSLWSFNPLLTMQIIVLRLQSICAGKIVVFLQILEAKYYICVWNRFLKMYHCI